MLRAAFFLLAIFAALPAAAQESAEMGQMRLYVQQLEERIRQLTGQNEQLLYELNRVRTQSGQPPLASAEAQGAQVTSQPLPAAGTDLAGNAVPQDLGSLSIAADDPLIAPDGGDHPGEPMDLSTLATGTQAPAGAASGATSPPVEQQPAGETQTARAAPADGAGAEQSAPTTALSGSSRDEYDLAYGYVLTGDYALAEKSFQNWLSAFPSDPQAADARFWLAESHLQQGEYREAANTFLQVYKAAPESSKGPDALLKLGVSLSALGERNAACATLAEVGRKYPQAPDALMKRVDHEVDQAGC